MHEPKVVCPEQARQALRRGPRRRERRDRAPRQRAAGSRLLSLLAAFIVTACLALVLLMPPGLRLGGVQVLVVVSGSMHPAVKTGDLVAIRPVDPEAIQVGDIITFADHESPRLLITHRVMTVTDGDNGPVFTTKGDANPVPDKLPVAAAQVAGRVQYRIPYGGHVVMFLRSPAGTLSLVVVPGLLLLLNWRRFIEIVAEESETA